MTRPRKNTVDYFPHSTTHGKTMFIIEQRYGNDGYAFWFKLLEELGKTEGHFLDLNEDASMEYLRSIIRREDSFVTEILDLLAKLNAIDAELWSSKIVWCQNFVDGVSNVYTGSRHCKPPARPDNYAAKPHATDISTQHNPQSRVEESKVEKSKVKKKSMPEKILFSECVYLTDQEHQKLISKYGRDPTEKAIEILNNAIMSKGYKYKSHYHTILGWPMEEAPISNQGGHHYPCCPG